jgi:predicted nucleic acid-binding protein
VDGYLLETSALSALLDPEHDKHAIVKSTIAGLSSGAPVYVSSVALAELAFGVKLYEACKGSLPKADNMLAGANSYPKVDVTRHTSLEYAELKKNIALKYLAVPLSKDDRKRWIENWVDKNSGQTLGIDENDLWQCAQARERNLVLVTIDRRIKRISEADQILQLLHIG